MTGRRRVLTRTHNNRESAMKVSTQLVLLFALILSTAAAHAGDRSCDSRSRYDSYRGNSHHSSGYDRHRSHRSHSYSSPRHSYSYSSPRQSHSYSYYSASAGRWQWTAPVYGYRRSYTGCSVRTIVRPGCWTWVSSCR